MPKVKATTEKEKEAYTNTYLWNSKQVLYRRIGSLSSTVQHKKEHQLQSITPSVINPRSEFGQMRTLVKTGTIRKVLH